MFEKVMYLSIFYYMCFVEEISEDMVDKSVTEETDPYLEGREYFRVSNYREDNWK